MRRARRGKKPEELAEGLESDSSSSRPYVAFVRFWDRGFSWFVVFGWDGVWGGGEAVSFLSGQFLFLWVLAIDIKSCLYTVRTSTGRLLRLTVHQNFASLPLVMTAPSLSGPRDVRTRLKAPISF
jgi:hypothetical protein